MKRSAVQFGAGNIGRGFIAQLFYESGLEVVFVDVAPPILEALNGRREYTIHVVGPGAHEVRVSGVRAVDGRSRDAVAEEVACAEIVCTAVGAGALPHIASNLAAGLLLRHRRGGDPLNILICENLHDASGLLHTLVADQIPSHDQTAVLAKTGFVQAVVSRMVPLQTPDDVGGDPLAIRVEAYKRLPVDATAVVGTLLEIPGVEPAPNFLAHVERKLYTHNCAHATLGYLGWLRRWTYGYEALHDPSIGITLAGVLEETGAALIRKHGFDPKEHAAYVADLLERFANEALGDTCFRLARDPLRKLAPDDRLVGAARLCCSQSVEPIALIEVIAAALRFDAPEDPSAVEMQARISKEGIRPLLAALTGMAPDDPLLERIEAAYLAGDRIQENRIQETGDRRTSKAREAGP